jgi:hypothetical protein
MRSPLQATIKPQALFLPVPKTKPGRRVEKTVRSGTGTSCRFRGRVFKRRREDGRRLSHARIHDEGGGRYADDLDGGETDVMR